MQKTVFFLDGPIGVGKTSLGQAAAIGLDFGYIDGDHHSAPGHWLRSILRTSRSIVSACEASLQSRQAVLVSYPLRCTNWVFYSQTFCRMGIATHCIGLAATLDAIGSRERKLDQGEIIRSREMIQQGYGRRKFSSAFLRTDEAPFDETQHKLQLLIRELCAAC